MSPQWLAITSALAALAAAFFAGAETAFLAADPVRLSHLAEKGDRRARRVLAWRDKPETVLSIVLVGTNLGVIGATATFTALMIQVFGKDGATIATLILVPSLMIFQEIVPKGIFLYYADQLAVGSVYPMQIFGVILYPIIKTFSSLSRAMARLFGADEMDEKVSMTMEELLFHLRGSEKAGAISGDTMAMVLRAVDLLKFTASDVMVPMDQVVMVADGLDLDAYDDVFRKERFSRMPLYKGTPQNVIGILSIHALLEARYSKSGVIKPNKVLFVDAATPLTEMMVRMKNHGEHMAMVRSDDALVGMTTLEDILERLVGAITDEFH